MRDKRVNPSVRNNYIIIQFMGYADGYYKNVEKFIKLKVIKDLDTGYLRYPEGEVLMMTFKEMEVVREMPKSEILLEMLE